MNDTNKDRKSGFLSETEAAPVEAMPAYGFNPAAVTGTFSYYEPLQMLEKKEVVKMFNTRDFTLKMWQELGMLKGIKTGRGWVFSRKEIFDFQQRYAGYDISNRLSAIEAFEEVKNRENLACQLKDL